MRTAYVVAPSGDVIAVSVDWPARPQRRDVMIGGVLYTGAWLLPDGEGWVYRAVRQHADLAPVAVPPRQPEGNRITAVLLREPSGRVRSVPVVWSAYCRPAVATLDARDCRQVLPLPDGRWLYEPVEGGEAPAACVVLADPEGDVGECWVGLPLPPVVTWQGDVFQRWADRRAEDGRPLYLHLHAASV